MQVVTVVAQRSDAVRRYVEETGLPFNILVDESREPGDAAFVDPLEAAEVLSVDSPL